MRTGGSLLELCSVGNQGINGCLLTLLGCIFEGRKPVFGSSIDVRFSGNQFINGIRLAFLGCKVEGASYRLWFES